MTQIGAFLTSSAQCIAVDVPSRPDPPFVVISAPGAVGNCDDLTLEGSATFASSGMLLSQRILLVAAGFQSKAPSLDHRMVLFVVLLLPAEIRLIGATNVTWDVTLAGGEQSTDISNVSKVLDEVRTETILVRRGYIAVLAQHTPADLCLALSNIYTVTHRGVFCRYRSTAQWMGKYRRNNQPINERGEVRKHANNVIKVRGN